ncbi:unnamed protein product, partial [Rotaria sp. Silwood1]
MSEFFRYRVVTWSSQTNTTIIVAGRTNESGSTAEYLSLPYDIYVDATGNAVYVANSGNNRIQKWTKGAREGITGAGPSKITEDNTDAWFNPTNTHLKKS